jgi:hypothetical protein
MIPDKARILTCPHCGEKKEVLSLVSGNTFGMRQWTDFKRDAPMLPEVSLVQKCNKCGHYFLLSRQEGEEQGNSYSTETGHLDFHELRKAMAELRQTDVTENEWKNICLMLVWAYNDMSRYKDRKEKPTEEDTAFFISTVKEILPYMQKMQELEMRREIGDFDECIRIGERLLKAPLDDFNRSILQMIMEKVKQKDSEVCELKF